MYTSTILCIFVYSLFEYLSMLFKKIPFVYILKIILILLPKILFLFVIGLELVLRDNFYFDDVNRFSILYNNIHSLYCDFLL